MLNILIERAKKFQRQRRDEQQENGGLVKLQTWSIGTRVVESHTDWIGRYIRYRPRTELEEARRGGGREQLL